jgi:hypothetical protein
MIMKSVFKKLVLVTALGAAGPAWAQSANYQATWFNANEPGWGLTVAHQGDVLFPAWFTYGSAGQVFWYAVSGATRAADGSYTGEVFRFTGRPFNQVNGQQAFLTSSKVGTATLRFSGTNALTFNYTVDGISQSKNLTRFSFGTAPTCTFTTGSRVSATNYSDIWNVASESGWGVSMEHQDDNIFLAWYTYNANGNPQWVTGLASKQSDGSYKGDLNRPNSGTAFSSINGAGATSFPIPKVGEVELRFTDGESAQFKYRLDNIEQTKSLKRFVFASPVSICSAGGTGGSGGGGGSTSSDCYRIPLVGDERGIRSTALPSNQVSNETERVVGNGTFEGQSVRFVDYFDAQNRRTARNYFRINGSTVDVLAIDGYDSATQALSSRTRFTPPQQFPINPPTSGLEIRYTGEQQLFGPVPMTNTIQYLQKYTRLANESVTVPLGSFQNTCRVKVETTVTTSIAGFSFSTNIVSDQWTNGSIGVLKTDSTTTTGAPAPTTSRLVSETTTFRAGQ